MIDRILTEGLSVRRLLPLLQEDFSAADIKSLEAAAREHFDRRALVDPVLPRRTWGDYAAAHADVVRAKIDRWHAKLRARTQAKLTQRTCTVCGEKFVPVALGLKRDYCGDTCKKRAYRQRKMAA